MKVGLPFTSYYLSTNTDTAINWLYNGRMPYDIDNINSAILTATNESVDLWNSYSQMKNQNHNHKLISHDSFADTDDPHGYLAELLTESVLNSFNANGVPTHVLNLKVLDIVLITRSMKEIGLATNTRLQIIHIGNKVIRAQVINEPHRPPVLIPRIRFKFRLPYGQSFKMIRCQFPLRLAYSFTYNRSQSQTLHKVLLDSRIPPFEHGHLYVALSRHRNPDNLRIFLNEKDLHTNPIDHTKYMPVIQNVVYPTIISHCLQHSSLI
jgi:ATP-dependent DNA helicase PIF1